MVENLRTTCMRKPEKSTLVASEAGKSETWIQDLKSYSYYQRVIPSEPPQVTGSWACVGEQVVGART